MGLEKLSETERNFLLEIARMSYGSREGAAGGRGHIGQMMTQDGRTRIIKFDTHGEKPDDDAERTARETSTDLRYTLMRIARAAGLGPDVLADIRRRLGVRAKGDKDIVVETRLLDRTISAKVVELIGGRRIWSEAGYDKTAYKSGKNTSFAEVSKSAEDSANIRTVGSVGTIGTAEEIEKKMQEFIGLGIGTLPRERRNSVRNLVNRVLSAATLGDVRIQCLSMRDLEAAALKCLFRILMVKGGVTADAVGGAGLKSYLRESAEKTGILDAGWMTDLMKDKAVLDWCVENGERHGAGVEDWDADTLLAETLTRALKEDIHRGRGGNEPVTCEFAKDGQTVRIENVGASVAAALKGVFGVKDNTPSAARRELDMFAAFAREHQNAGDFYMKFTADGKNLTSAGSRNILRGEGSKAENNDVRQRLKECVADLYNGNIPPSVKQVMTGFDDEGHPLSAKRVGLIKAAIDADRLQSAYSGKISLHTLALGCGLTPEDINEPLDQLAERYSLSDEERQTVGRMTVAYLASQAEEVSDKFRLPDVDVLKRQISEGVCNGTYLALQHLQKIPGDRDVVLAGVPIDALVNDAIRLMDGDDAEALAYFAGKFRKIDLREAGRRSFSSLNLILLKDLVERKKDLLTFRERQGKMTFDDLWQLRFGTKMPNGARIDQQDRFIEKHLLLWIDEFEAEHPGLRARNEVLVQGGIEGKVANLGIPLKQAGLLELGEKVDKLDISHKSSVYDTRSEMYTGDYRKKSRLITQVALDMDRATDRIFVNGQPIGIDKEGNAEDARQKADNLYNALATMLKYDKNNPVPEDDLPNQLKTALLVCTQAGNQILTLIGLNPRGADHYPTQKSFVRQENGNVRYTLAATFDDRHLRVSYDIAPDGTSSCLEATIQEVQAQPLGEGE